MQNQNTPGALGKRTKTARTIQQAALRLAVEHGYRAMTIKMIAEHAGISRRTFFNHYKNKQDAIAGPNKVRLDHTYDWFEGSEKPLLEDLQRLVAQVVTDASPDRSVIRDIGKVLDRSPDLQPVFSAMITTFTGELRPLLSRRLGAAQEPVAQLLSYLVSQAIAQAFREWTAGDEITLDQVVDRAQRSLVAVSQVLKS